MGWYENITHIREMQWLKVTVHYFSTNISKNTLTHLLFSSNYMYIVFITCWSSYIYAFLLNILVLCAWAIHFKTAAFRTSKYLLGHRFSHSASKQRRGFLLLLCGNMWRQELRNRANTWKKVSTVKYNQAEVKPKSRSSTGLTVCSIAAFCFQMWRWKCLSPLSPPWCTAGTGSEAAASSCT